MFEVTVVLMADGMSSTSVIPVEIFHYAGVLWNKLRGVDAKPLFRVTTASLDGAAVYSPRGLSITPETSIAEIEHTDIVIIPTSGLEWDAKLVENSVLLPWLRKQYAAGAYLAGICLGVAYLAEAGLLRNRMATTHWAISGELSQRYPDVDWRSELFVTEDARILCSGGVYAVMDLCLYLVAKLCGQEIAVQCAKALLLPMPRTHQSGYAVLPLSPPHDDERIRSVETYLQSAYAQDILTDSLARRAGLGARTFVRRFKAATGHHPTAYLQALRIAAAKVMLETHGQPIQQVSSAVGYDDVAFFRTLFKRITGMTPAEYRAHFGALGVLARARITAPEAVG